MLKEIFGNKRRIESSIPLDAIAQIIEGSYGNVKRNAKRISFSNKVGETVVETKSVRKKTVDGHEVSSIVTVRSELPKQFNTINEIKLSALNTMASMSALIKEQKNGKLSIVNRLTVYTGDIDSWRLYIHLIGLSAVLQAETVVRQLQQTFGLDVNELELPESENPSKWGENDFQAAASALNHIGILCTADENGLTAEVPINHGAISSIMGDQASLITIQADMSHPVIGSGLFFKLELPMAFQKNITVCLSNRLNLYEFNAVDLPPFFGSWCNSHDTGSLAYVGFWPNLLYRPGIVLNLVTWMVPRNRQVIGLIQNNQI